MPGKATEILKLHGSETGLCVGDLIQPIRFKDVLAKGAKPWWTLYGGKENIEVA